MNGEVPEGGPIEIGLNRVPQMLRGDLTPFERVPARGDFKVRLIEDEMEEAEANATDANLDFQELLFV